MTAWPCEIKLKPFSPHIVSTVFVEFVQRIRKPFEKRPIHFFPSSVLPVTPD